MTTTTIAGRDIEVDSLGYMTQYDQWSPELGAELAKAIGIEMTDAHWEVVTFLREDFVTRGETATSYVINAEGPCPTRQQFALFGKKPVKKMAYIAGLPVPAACV